MSSDSSEDGLRGGHSVPTLMDLFVNENYWLSSYTIGVLDDMMANGSVDLFDAWMLTNSASNEVWLSLDAFRLRAETMGYSWSLD